MKQHIQQLQRENAEPRRQLEVLQTEELHRRLQESDVACCPCNDVTVGSTTGPSLNPFWQVTSGECQLEDNCFTSPNYLEGYGETQACVIEITDEWVGYLDVQEFNMEVNLGTLFLNKAFIWSTDDIESATGVKICR